MNNPKATSILNEILTKLSAITSIEDSPASEQVSAVAEEAFATKVLDMEAKLAEMKSLIEVEMSSQKKQKEELSAQVEKLSAQPAAEAITHNPESETEKQPVYNFGTQRAMSTLDRVFNRLNK